MSEDKTQTTTTVSPQQSSYRIGVFICECGGRISQYLDADELCLHAASLPGVIYAKHEAYPCSKDGLERINQSIQDYHLDRVLVAGCSPRLVYKHFNQAIRHPPQAGEEVRNSAHISEEIEIINIRDLRFPGENGGFSKTASKNWKDHFNNAYFDATLHHAKAMLEIGIARLTNIVPERTYTGTVVKTAIVIGDSLPGLTAALSLAADGIPVSIVQQRNKLEDTHPQPAHASWPDQQGRQFLEQRVKEVARQPLITTFTSSQIRQISGRPGDYQVVLEQNGQNTCLTAGVLLLAIDPRPGYAGINDEHTGQALSCSPDENVRRLATLLHLPQDHQGYIFEPRIRLRPGRYVDDGIYLLGSSHQPVDLHEALFQSYLTSARARRFLHQESLQLEASIAEINPELCTGCGECAQVCLTNAIRLIRREAAPGENRFNRNPEQAPSSSILSLAEVEPFECSGCGNCAVTCPVKAITIPGWEDASILAQITAALRSQPSPLDRTGNTRPAPRVLVLGCEWSAYSAAELAGIRWRPGEQGQFDRHPVNISIIRMNCSARFDPYHILWAFLNGADGVLLGACPPGECHYGDGNRYAQERIVALKKQLDEHGVNPERARLEFMSGDDDKAFTSAITDFSNDIISNSGDHYTWKGRLGGSYDSST